MEDMTPLTVLDAIETGAATKLDPKEKNEITK
jgi:hypothetical protein